MCRLWGAAARDTPNSIVFEQDFLCCSYGFRPGRSAHGALKALWKYLMDAGGGWIIDLDIRKFFDTMSHTHLREILASRVCDGVLVRLINKWLRAGVWEKGSITYPLEGSPQGGVASPLLSNIYLHTVLDKWFEEQVKPRMRGQAHLVRFADDAVLIFSEPGDAQRVMKVLPKRFGRYGLTVHPEKTRIVRFSRPKEPKDGKQGRRPQTFNFLGFTHYWGLSRKGNWIVKRKTEKKRLGRALKAVAAWCKRNRHVPVKDQQRILTQKLYGHYSYYGITGNAPMLGRFHYEVHRVWRKWLNRRTWGNPMPWDRFNKLLTTYPLPPPRVAHSVYAAKL